jgi:hypothetical protein
MLQRIYIQQGYQGQKVFIIPSKDMVIVRLGLTDESQFDINEVLLNFVVLKVAFNHEIHKRIISTQNFVFNSVKGK